MAPIRLLLVVLALALGLAAPPEAARASQVIAAKTARIPIAVVPFALAPGTPRPPIDVAEVIRADLASTGRFVPTAPADLPAQPTERSAIDAAAWRRAKIDYVVIGRVARVHDGGHEVEFWLVDTRTEAPVVGFMVPSAEDALRPTALEIARLIRERLDPGRPAAVSK